MVVTDTAQDDIRDDAIAYIQSTFTHIAVGDDNTTPVGGDTTLGNELKREVFVETSGPTNGVYVMSMRLSTTELNGSTIKEVGIFDASSGGTMLCRLLTTEYAKTSDKEVWIDVQFQIATGTFACVLG